MSTIIPEIELEFERWLKDGTLLNEYMMVRKIKRVPC